MAGYYDRDRNVGTTRTAAGTMNHPMTHHGNAAEYQCSSIPWLQELASPTNVNVDFPFVTRWIIIAATGAAVKLAFSSTGIGQSQYITIPNGTMSPRIEVKCTEIWVTAGGAMEIMAGLTNVKAADFPSIIGLPGILGA